MTEIDFINSNIFLRSINESGVINFNITPQRNSTPSQGWTISSIAIPINAVIGDTEQIRRRLQEVTKITMVIPPTSITNIGVFTSTATPIVLNITSRIFYRQNNIPSNIDNFEDFEPFFYFKIVPINIENNSQDPYIIKLQEVLQIGNPQIEEEQELDDLREDVQINMTPYIDNLTFSFNEDNAIIGNAVQSRRSGIRQESDRSQADINPSNINTITLQVAKKAEIQDSLYTTTGWINARYKGTKTSAKTLNDIPATLRGTSFKGEEFTKESPSNLVCNISEPDRILENYLWAGDSELPKVLYTTFKDTQDGFKFGIIEGVRDNIGIIESVTLSSINEISNITINTQGTPISFRPKVGDLLDIKGEVIKVLRILNTVPGATVVKVQRGHNNTERISGVHTNIKVKRLELRDRVFKFTQGLEKVEAVNNRRIWVRDLNTVIYTDEFGRIIKEVKCSE